ncbi:hypothetical protein ACVBAX_21380 [Robertmurraya sp. GLU-23]
MRKIFLATSEKDSKEIQDLIKSIEPGIPIVSLQSKSEVMAALRSPFVLCIVSCDLVDVKVLEQTELSGKVMILDPSNQIKTNHSNIVICISSSDLVFKIRMSKFNDLKYDKRQGILPSPKNSELKKNDDKPIVSNQERIEVKDPLANQAVEESKEDSNKREIEENKISENKKPEIVNIDEAENETSVTNDEVEPQVGQTPINMESVEAEKTVVEEDSTEYTTEKTKASKIQESKGGKKNSSLTEKALGIGEAMDLVTYKNKKTVGLWAPLSAGVTTFLVDFAIYLQQFEAPIAVVEVPKKNQHHLKILERFGSKPDNWVSLIENFHTTTEPNNKSLWMYRGVRWFPLGIKDLTYKRDKEFTNNYFLAVKRTKFVMVDLPTGEMDAATLDSLPHLDELWVFVDDDFDRQLDWKEFISNTLIDKYQLPIKLIHSRTTPLKSRPKDVAEKFNLPLIAVLPAMWDLCVANKHQNKPLIDNLVAFKKLEPSFYQLAKELIGEDLGEQYKPAFWLRLKRKLMGSIDSN